MSLTVFTFMMMLPLLLVFLPGSRMSMAPGRGGRRGRGGGKNRAMRIKHKFSIDNEDVGSKADDWILMAPGNGIVNKIKVEWESDNVVIDATHTTEDGYFGLFYTKASYPDGTARFPLGNSFNGVPNDDNQVHLGYPALIPLYCANTGLGVSQSGAAEAECIIRMNAGEELHFRASMFDLLDEQSTKAVEIDVIVYFSFDTDLGRYQETVPLSVLVGDEESDLVWAPPVTGIMYATHGLAFRKAVVAPQRPTIAFNAENVNSVQYDYWLEVYSKGKIVDFVMQEGFGHTLFLPEMYLDRKGLRIIRRDENGAVKPPMLFTGYFAPQPGAKVTFNMSGVDTDYEEIPFPVYIEEMDVSLAWTTSAAGDQILEVFIYDSDDSVVGTAQLYENRALVFSYLVAATTGQDRVSERIDRRLTFGDIFEVACDADLNRYNLLFTGKVPDHKYGIRPCSRFVHNEYLMEGSDFE